MTSVYHKPDNSELQACGETFRFINMLGQVQLSAPTCIYTKYEIKNKKTYLKSLLIQNTRCT